MQLTQGTLLHGGTYRIEKTLGQGSFGITYLAVHTSLDRKVAIKEFFMKELNSRGDDGSITGMSDGSLSYNYGQKFKKEALNLSRLDHPNIVRVSDSFEENGTYYYVMDFIEGENLNDYLKHNSLSPNEAISIITDVAKALMYMHEDKNMLHLDLKPGNIMRRSSDGHIFLIDFGLSKHFSDSGQPETSTTIGLGTAGYAPVEQSNQAKNGEFRPTIDVYALGATLFKLLTRETPPPASDVVSDDEIIEDKLRANGITGPVIDVVVNAMLPSVKKRTQTVKAFIASLDFDSKSLKSSSNPLPQTTSEETQYIGSTVAGGEETVIAGSTKVAHPGFNISTYELSSKYRNDPVGTGKQANNGDIEAILAMGVMCLRGEGVSQNTETARLWFLKLESLGDDRGSKIISQWPQIVGNYTRKTTISSGTSSKTSSDANDGCSFGTIFVVILVFTVIIIMCVRGCSSNNDSDYYYATDSVVADTCYADTVACEYYSSGYHEVYYDDGSYYKGLFNDGLPHGKGTYVFSNGDKYVGEWVNGNRTGYGTYTWPEKRTGYMYKYVGYWVNGNMEGKGTAYYVGGTSESGIWKDGKLVSDANNSQYPITININQYKETNIQKWCIKKIVLYADCTVVYSSVCSKDDGTTAYIDGSEYIEDSNGKKYYILKSTLPCGINTNFVLSRNQTFNFEERFPAIDKNASSIRYDGGLNKFGYVKIPW